jgi:hypothetical protein
MRALSTSELLCVWERGCSQTLTQRALTLLAAACPETPLEDLALLTVGERDRRLLTIREWAFGPRLDILADCPECREKLEVEINIPEIRSPSPADVSREFSVAVADCEARFRLLRVSDLACLSPSADAQSNQLRLLERCLLWAISRDGERITAERLPAEAIAEMSARMAEADPQADVQLGLSCPACQHQWSAALDIVSLFWSEINAWAGRLLRQVHILASAYGWSEAEILALSPWRRQTYLQMVGA